MPSTDADSRVLPAVGVALLRSGARLPARMSSQAAGYDLYACLEGAQTSAAATRMGVTDPDPWHLMPGARMAVPTGIAIALPEGLEGQVRPRSGLARNHGVTVLNAPGTIDADYRGEIIVLLINHGDAPHQIAHGDRIAQLVIAPVARVTVELRAQLDLQTERGGAGFGSTGR